jgi:hypothetical protein
MLCQHLIENIDNVLCFINQSASHLTVCELVAEKTGLWVDVYEFAQEWWVVRKLFDPDEHFVFG